MHVSQYHRHFSTNNDKQRKDHKEEAEHIVEPPQPNTGQNEEEFDEESSEGESSSSKNKKPRRIFPSWNFSRDLIGPDWELDGLRPSADESSQKGEGHWNAEPKG